MDADDFETLIVGGGLVGSTLALALASAGVRVGVIDATASDAPPDPRASFVAAGPWRMWRALGLVEGLEGAAQPVTSLNVESVGGGFGEAALGFDAHDTPAAEGAPLGWMVENADVARALSAAIGPTDIDRRAPARVSHVDLGARRAEIVLDDGRRLHAPLVVGAEGRRSRVRDAMGATAQETPYRQSAVTATLALERPHAGVARQLFDPLGPLALLPLTGGRANLVWTLPERTARALIALSDIAFEAHLSRRLSPAVGPVHLVGARRAYPLSASRSERLTGARAALVGEAAHGVHPVAGQGLNLGLKDVATLAQVLVEARRLGEDIGGAAVLERYARWRRVDALALTAGVDLAARVFSARAGLVRAAGRAAIALTQASEVMRRGFAREAAGDAGDAPRLLRGLTL